MKRALMETDINLGIPDLDYLLSKGVGCDRADGARPAQDFQIKFNLQCKKMVDCGQAAALL